MKIKEKVLKEVVDKTIHLKSRNEIIPEVIDLTLAEVGKVIDDCCKFDYPEVGRVLKQKLGLK